MVKLPPAADPEMAAVLTVCAVLTADSQGSVVRLASHALSKHWRGTFGIEDPIEIQLSPEEVQERVAFLRAQHELSMNDIFQLFGLFDKYPVCPEQKTLGDLKVPITLMEQTIEDVLYDFEVGEQMRLRVAPPRKARRRKSKEEKRRRYEQKKQRRLSKKRRQRK